MSKNLRNIAVATRSARRGGTMFTMVIFVMMLTSTALMYYYFQRTRVLQREISALKSGVPAEEASSGFFDFLEWGSKTPGEKETQTTEATKPTATPAPAVVEATAPQQPDAGADSKEAAAGVLEPGAASTPRPAVSAQAPATEDKSPAVAGATPQAESSQPAVLEPITDETVNAEAEATEEPAEAEDSADKKERVEPKATPSSGTSVYDMPAVRVRSPRRNESR